MAPSRILPVSILFVSLAAALTIGCQNRLPLAGASHAQLQAVQVPVQAAPVQAAPVQTASNPVQSAPVVAAPVAAAPVAPQVGAPAAPMFEQAGTPAGLGEQQLNTNVGPAPAAAAPSANGVVLETKNLKVAKVRTPSDERLPKWVPVKGRLSVVGSNDLAENLGLVPAGTTKKTDERISVADKLAEENAARASKSDPMTQGSSWSYSKAGRFRNHR